MSIVVAGSNIWYLVLMYQINKIPKFKAVMFTKSSTLYTPDWTT